MKQQKKHAQEGASRNNKVRKFFRIRNCFNLTKEFVEALNVHQEQWFSTVGCRRTENRINVCNFAAKFKNDGTKTHILATRLFKNTT
jgi:hypothetical protein